MKKWFEDFEIGARFKGSKVQVSEADIKRFAAEFDPQPFHLDDAAARNTIFKGLAASGWHTAALGMKLAVEMNAYNGHPMIGLGVDNLRWMFPVRPGDTLRIEGEVVGLNPSKTKPQGVVLVKYTLFNQNDEAVYTFTPIGFVPTRPK
jgi:acyl dehydratase